MTDEPSRFATTTLIGGSSAGDGSNAVHVDIVIGRRGGPVETAWLTGLATPAPGHAPFPVVLRPNLPVKPMTLFVNRVAIRDDRHGTLTRGAAQAGVAGAIARAVGQGLLPTEAADDVLVIAAVEVDPAADNDDAVYGNALAATLEAARAAVERRPTVAEVAVEAAHPWNAGYHRHRN